MRMVTGMNFHEESKTNNLLSMRSNNCKSMIVMVVMVMVIVIFKGQ